MSYRTGVLAAALLVGCAQAGVSLDHPDASGGGGDAKHDSSGGGDDAPMGTDASCNPVMQEMLTNEAFDGSPLATGWTEARIDPAYGLVTTTGPGVTPMTTPNMVWLGGFEKPAAQNKDSLTQNITIPAGTTSLTLSGNYWVVSADVPLAVYDRSLADLASSAGVAIENAVTLDNTHVTSTWTPFTKTFSSPHAGETIQIKLSSASDPTDVTDFFYDSLSLKATHPASGCP